LSNDGFSTTGESMVFQRNALSQWDINMTGMESSTHSYFAFNKVEKSISRLIFCKAKYDDPITMANVITMRNMCLKVIFMYVKYGIDA
jgi:hypothetical protein